MSGLVLKLGPKERVLINGAVIENGDRRSRLSIVSPSANILRLKDAIHPDEANTPVRRVCYSAQLVLSGDSDPDDARFSHIGFECDQVGLGRVTVIIEFCDVAVTDAVEKVFDIV